MKLKNFAPLMVMLQYSRHKKLEKLLHRADLIRRYCSTRRFSFMRGILDYGRDSANCCRKLTMTRHTLIPANQRHQSPCGREGLSETDPLILFRKRHLQYEGFVLARPEVVFVQKIEHDAEAFPGV